MIVIHDIISLMRDGFYHDDINFGMSVKDLKKRLGSPDGIIGDSQMGYLIYNPLRIGYLGDIVDGIVILFDNEHDFRFNIDFDNLEGENDAIRKDMKIHELIKVFNNNGVMWSAQYQKNELDYVSINVEKGSEVLFDLDTGYINRIGFKPGNASK